MVASMQDVQAWIQNENARLAVVTVGDPEFHKGGMLSKSYLDFSFTVSYPDGTGGMSCRHRFSEVEGVRAKLKDVYMPLGIVVPATPSKGLTQNSADVNSVFVKERMRGLTLWLNHMFANPFLANDSTWLEFMGFNPNGENMGLFMLKSALACVEQPFKFTIVQRIETIKNEIGIIEQSMKSQLQNLRDVDAAHRALRKAYDGLHNSMGYFAQGEVINVKCFNGYPFDTTESIINPPEVHVKHSISSYDNLCLASGVCSAAPDEVSSCILIPSIEYELNQTYAFREMLKMHEEMMVSQGSLILKLEKEEMGQNQAKIEDYKSRLTAAEVVRSDFYKGFIYFTLMMYARHRGPLIRESYAGMAAVKLAEASQAHTASLEFFKCMKVHPVTAANRCNDILASLGLHNLNAEQFNLGPDASQLSDVDARQCALMEGLFEAAISGNYGPLQGSAPPVPPVPSGFGGNANFSDNDSDGVTGGIEDLQKPSTGVDI